MGAVHMAAAKFGYLLALFGTGWANLALFAQMG